MSVLTDLKNRGVRDVFFLVCDGLKGLPEVVGNVWPQTIVQTCIIHLIRNTFRLASRRDWDALRRAIKPIYTAVNAAAAREAFDQIAETWGQRYPAIIRLWDNAWTEFIPFLDYDVEIRRVLCSTDEIVNSGAAADGCSAPSFRPRRSCLRPVARSRGQGGAPGWTNDLDRGEDRGNVGSGGRGRPPSEEQSTGTGSAAALLGLTA
jgi:putative transposase